MCGTQRKRFPSTGLQIHTPFPGDLTFRVIDTHSGPHCLWLVGLQRLQRRQGHCLYGLEDCTTAHTDVKGGVQRQGEILINNLPHQALSRRGVTWTPVSLWLQLDPELGLQAWRRLLPSALS